ncbi:HAMP domain-containing histidine kinase [Clostridium sp. CF011]|uniref:sensor histidine kinase n=1 Tax=Clostridium sp. CF011 TaxID=2843318 RepID=UPI001C0D5561|nr:HAMP domain-containing sensor histidine kinase [Clostridium sp. CF011]MBU3093709.1 HAMP domain-containing histidine kinase [Clostridium sp. CF011]WAG71815.1 HAMP domain-containing histidine kinase [Clostridium sp. CF011]
MLTIVFGILCILLIMYIIYIQMQLHNINRQMTKRLREKTRQPISLELINRDLNILAATINKCLAREEKLCIDGLKREKRFKELIANISHDLRTPLTAINGYQQLMEKGELTDNQRKKLGIAQKHTVELGQLIEHFFEYSYLINSEPALNLQRINLTNFVTECLAASVPILEENNLAVHIEKTPPIFILADKEMVLRIIQNLIRNCVQHSNGDIEVRLLVMENAVISFRNPVKSTSEIDVERLFDRFYTGDKARRNTTGLGLSIVRLLAELMGGSAGAKLQNGLLDIQVRLHLFNDKSKGLR